MFIPAIWAAIIYEAGFAATLVFLAFIFPAPATVGATLFDLALTFAWPALWGAILVIWLIESLRRLLKWLFP